ASNGAGEGIQLWYDERGNLICSVDASGNTTSTEYLNDRPVNQTTPDGLITRYTYDDHGSMIRALMPTGLIYTFTYDARGRFTAIHVAGGTLKSFEYDGASNV